MASLYFFSDKSVPIDGYQGNTNPILYQYSSYFTYLSFVTFGRYGLRYSENWGSCLTKRANQIFQKRCFVVGFLVLAQCCNWSRSHLVKLQWLLYHEHTKIYYISENICEIYILYIRNALCILLENLRGKNN